MHLTGNFFFSLKSSCYIIKVIVIIKVIIKVKVSIRKYRNNLPAFLTVLALFSEAIETFD